MILLKTKGQVELLQNEQLHFYRNLRSLHLRSVFLFLNYGTFSFIQLASSMTNSMLVPQSYREVKLPSAFKRPFVCMRLHS